MKFTSAIQTFFGYVIDYDRSVRLFSWHHVLLVACGVLAIVVPLKTAKWIHASGKDALLRATFFWLLLVLELIYHGHNWLGGHASFPLHICSFGSIMTIALLKTNSKKVFEYALFFAVIGGFMAMFIPFSMGFPYTNIRYYHFILIHMILIMVPLYYHQAYGYRVDLRETFRVFMIVMFIMPIMNQVNMFIARVSTTDYTNYWFITEIPDNVVAMFDNRAVYTLTLTTLVFVSMMVLYRVSNRDRERRKRIIRVH